uniref:Tudor domain-containing protein n=2 Tax=unclassified Panagrolaimus TaxID=2684985 RepID=A0AC34FL33_9BILA
MAQRYRAQIGELDISEEAEEIRELLYEIVTEYPTGIDAKFLEEQYDKKYVETGIGTPLSKDWLQQLQLAGEFEVKEIGGSATVYIVHKDAIVHMPLPPNPNSLPEPITNMSLMKEALPENATKSTAEEITHTNGETSASASETSKDESNMTADVLTLSSDESYFYVRIEKDKFEFEKFLQKMTEFYTEHHKDPSITAEAIESNKLYVVLDASFNWCRILVKDSSDDSSIIPCFFVDYGELRSAVRSSLKKLESSFSTENIKPFAQCFALSAIPPKKCIQFPHLPTSTYSNTSQIKKIEHLQIKFNIKEIDEKHQYSIVTTLDASGKVMADGPFKALKSGIQTLSTKNAPPPPIPAANLNIICRDPKEMPTKKEIVHILSATDPDNISIRLEAWYPAPDYLYAAMTRDSENSAPPPKENIIEGKFFAAKFEDGWERVQIIRQSTTTPGGDYWIVYAVDIGYFHLIQREQLRLLTESVSSFNRILLAKCKLNGIKRNETGIWSREIQTAMQDILESASKSTVEFSPEGSWTQFDSFNAPKLPYACGKLTIDGKDFAEKLISMGLAEKAS